jgi:hypothetical protein
VFGGDAIDLQRTFARAMHEARSLRSDYTCSEHLLLALLTGCDPVADRLAAGGIDPDGVRDAVRDVPAKQLPVARHSPVTGERRRLAWPGARRTSLDPPFSVGADAAYEASLRLALARRERSHRPEHLALVLIALDPDVDRVLSCMGADHVAAWDAVAAAYPPPRRNTLLRLERGYWRRSRGRDLVTRYERATGQIALRPTMLTQLIAGPA